MGRRRAGRPRDWALLAGGFASLFAFCALTFVVTRHGFDSLDQVARAFVRPRSSPTLLSSMEVASFLGGRPGQTVIVCLGSILLWSRRRRFGLALPAIMAGAGVLQLAAKWAVDRPRPNLDPWGFPSAHVLSLVVLFGFLAYVLATSGARRLWRGLGVAACAAIVCTVAFSRMYLDAHWLSDVLGGFSMGGAYLLSTLWLLGMPLSVRALRIAAPVEERSSPVAAA